jgi:hypothetical protein
MSARNFMLNVIFFFFLFFFCLRLICSISQWNTWTKLKCFSLSVAFILFSIANVAKIIVFCLGLIWKMVGQEWLKPPVLKLHILPNQLPTVAKVCAVFYGDKSWIHTIVHLTRKLFREYISRVHLGIPFRDIVIYFFSFLCISIDWTLCFCYFKYHLPPSCLLRWSF